MPEPEPERDLTPYDLADRMRQGLPVTEAGHREIAAELDAVRVLVESHQAACIPAHATLKILLDRIRAES